MLRLTTRPTLPTHRDRRVICRDQRPTGAAHLNRAVARTKRHGTDHPGYARTSNPPGDSRTACRNRRLSHRHLLSKLPSAPGEEWMCRIKSLGAESGRTETADLPLETRGAFCGISVNCLGRRETGCPDGAPALHALPHHEEGGTPLRCRKCYPSMPAHPN